MNGDLLALVERGQELMVAREADYEAEKQKEQAEKSAFEQELLD